jgi:hypothetical protein
MENNKIGSADKIINDLKIEESEILEFGYKFRRLIRETHLDFKHKEKLDFELLSLLDLVNISYIEKIEQYKDIPKNIGNI